MVRSAGLGASMVSTMGAWMATIASLRENTSFFDGLLRGEGSAWPALWQHGRREPKAWGGHGRACKIAERLSSEPLPSKRHHKSRWSKCG